MKRKTMLKILAVVLALGMVISYIPTNVTAKTVVPQQAVTVDNAVLDEINKNGVATYWVDFKNTADLSQAYFMDWSERGWFVYETLKEQAEKTQSAAIDYLKTTGLTYKSFWLANRILVENSDKIVLASLQQLPNVVSISAQKQYILYEPEKVEITAEPMAIEPNIAHVRAPEAWELGYDGTGLVVASIDTGVRYTHQALVGQYRGNNGGGTFDHNYNWLNPIDPSDDVPRDGAGHGTHTMGTMVGDDGSANQIGIAPGAEWMACAGCPDGSCPDAALLGCGEFMAAPTDLNGENPNPDMRPNVVNNSWGDCGRSYDPWFADVVAGWLAAGVYPVFSNGNSSNCGYSSPPGLNTVGNPARYGNVTGVGSSTRNTGQYATHSNWGPTDNLDIINPVEGFAMMKPQVLAPGVNIRSSTPGSDTEYQGGWSGTSMSAPHVTGLVAMIMQAAPCLVGDYAAVETIIESTAVDMTYDDGSPLTPTNFPNFATGWGEIDALAAVELASGMCGNSVLYGTVTSDSEEPISGAKVEITGTDPVNNRTVYTNAAGEYSANVNADTFDMVVSAFGFENATAEDVVVADGVSVQQDFVLTELPNTLVTGVVYDDGIVDGATHGYPLYAKLTFSMTGFSQTVYTDPMTGEYEIVLYSGQEYNVNVQALVPGYQVLETTITPDDVEEYVRDYYLNIDNVACSAPGYQPEYEIMYDFEAGDHGFVSSGTNSSWARGIPTNGPGEAHSGSYVIATNPTGNYNANELSYMTSPLIDLTGFGTATPVIEFWQWRHIESASYDNATVEVTKDGGTTWIAVYGPVGGVNDTAYNKVQIALDPSFNVTNFQIRFKFKSDSSVQYEGWYVDDIGIAAAPVPAPTQVFFENFDSDNGGFVASGTNSSWAWGIPTSGPGSAHSAPNVWATNLAGNYNASEQSYITSPVIDLSDHAGLAPTLSFWHWMDSESNTWDWGSVQVTKDGGATWQAVYEKFGDILTWSPKSIALDPSYAVSNFQFRFFMRTDSSGQYPGWYIDDVKITVSEPYDIAVPCGTIPGGVVAGYVYDDNDNSPIVGADVYSDVVETQTFFIPEDPASEGLFWVFHPTATDPEDVVFTASNDLYGSDVQTVSIDQDSINQQDFYLGTGELSFDPTSMEVTMYMGDAPLTETLTISNLGTSEAMFELVEKDEGFVLPKLMIPAFKGELPQDSRPVSMGRAPEAANRSLFQASGESPFSGILAGEPAFAVDAYPGENLVYIPDTTLPGTWTIVGGVPGTEFFAGDFVGGDFSHLYVVNYTGNSLYSVNTETAAYTLIGTTTPPSGQTFSGLSGTPDGTMYGLTTTCATSNLVTVDIATAATTDLGALPGIACGIDLAYNTDDDMIYIVDLLTDNLFKVDPATMTVTEVGSLGVAANFAQGMDYEEESGVLYWAAYTTAGELRIIDTTTGASTLVGAFPGGAEVDSLAFATGGQSDVPWLSEDPISGTVPAAGSIDVDVIFDPTGAGLSQPGDYLAALKVKHDTPYTYPNIPVVLHLIAPGDFGTFNGHVLGYEACDVNPAALEGATVNFWQGGVIAYTTTTNAAGYYSYAVPEGIYDIEVMKDGYISQLEMGAEVVGGETITVDFTLRLEAPCISVDPTSLEQTQITDTVTTQTLTIMNTGAGDGVFELLELPVSSLLLDQLLQDPSFEAYTPNPYWDEYSATFGTPLCTVDDCGTGTGTGPRTGDVWSWFGGASAGDEGYVSQDVLMLPGTAEITFYVEQYVCGSAGASNYMALKIDGTELWRTDGTDPACGVLGYRLVTVDVGDFADGDTHEIMFDSVTVDGANFFLDDVELNLEAGGDVPWISLDPTAGVVFADSSTDVTVTYDSTGLAEGDYFASIRVKNPPAAAINVPVTLHVTGLRYLYLPLILK